MTEMGKSKVEMIGCVGIPKSSKNLIITQSQANLNFCIVGHPVLGEN